MKRKEAPARETSNFKLYRRIQAQLADYTLEEIQLIVRKYQTRKAAMQRARSSPKE